jgi:hypothetical protein
MMCGKDWIANMTILKKDTIIFYISRERSLLYTGNKQPAVVLEIPGTILHNMELIGKKELASFIRDALKKHDVKRGNILIMLAEDITFHQKIEELASDAEIETFFDLLPLHDTVGKRFIRDKSAIAIAACKSLCTELIKIFEEERFIVKGVVPLAAGKQFIPELNTSVDAKSILKYSELLCRYSLIAVSQK